MLRRRGLLAALLPSVDAYFSTHPGSLVEKLLLQGLRNTDERVLADKPVTPTFLFALLLYGPIAGHHRGDAAGALARAGHDPGGLRSGDARGADPPRHPASASRSGVREMFALQPRLEHPRGRRALRALEHPRFRAAYDLLLLRARVRPGAARTWREWWTRLQEVSAGGARAHGRCARGRRGALAWPVGSAAGAAVVVRAVPPSSA